MSTNISLIIGHRENSQERKDNLFHQLKYYNKTFLDIQRSFPNWKFDIWIIEQDTHSKITQLQQQLKLSIPMITQFCWSDKDFNRSWAANVGINLCHSDIALFSDNDIILKKETIVTAIKQLTTGRDKFGYEFSVLTPYENFLDLSPVQTIEWKKTGRLDYPNQVCRYGRPSSQITKVGGCYFVKRDFHLEIGGMDERMEYYGMEDDAYFFKYSRILEHQKRDWSPRLNHSLFHLYHQRINLEEVRNNPIYKQNCIYGRAICDMSYENLLKHIEEMKKNLGDPYKYARNKK